MFLCHTDVLDSKGHRILALQAQDLHELRKRSYTVETIKHSKAQAFREVLQTIFPRAKIGRNDDETTGSAEENVHAEARLTLTSSGP